MDITSAAIATIIASTVSSGVATLINRSNARKALADQLDGIIKIAIEYPYLESSAFTASWYLNRNSQDEKYLRYDNYCNLVFNFLERYCKHFFFRKSRIERGLDIKNWIRVHKSCWQYPSTPFENTDGYSKRFRDFIDQYLN